MITLVRAIQTCSACPSQWDAWDAAGNYYYLRYRWGHGTITQYPDADSLDLRAPDVQFSYGDSLDGVISLEDFAEKAGITLNL